MTFTCAIPGCHSPAAQLSDDGAGVCDDHFAMAPLSQRMRFLTVVRRLRALRQIWSDEERYDAVVASGRYLKLAHATFCAEEALDAAASRLTLAILASQGGGRSAPQPLLRQRA
ncbi:MAG: hypothetical protein K2Y29_06265 [Beijerinckiaceae bacterium]|nr:hypothetical protein [Beijerinckiaceae bacterium]